MVLVSRKLTRANTEAKMTTTTEMTAITTTTTTTTTRSEDLKATKANSTSSGLTSGNQTRGMMKMKMNADSATAVAREKLFLRSLRIMTTK